MSLFSNLARVRRANKAAAKPFIVRSVTKGGAVSKMRPSYYDHHATFEEARKTVARLEQLNPGKSYVITDDLGAILVQVECEKADGYRWLTQIVAGGSWARFVNGCVFQGQAFFAVTDMGRFTEALRAAGGKVL